MGKATGFLNEEEPLAVLRGALRLGHFKPEMVTDCLLQDGLQPYCKFFHGWKTVEVITTCLGERWRRRAFEGFLGGTLARIRSEKAHLPDHLDPKLLDKRVILDSTPLQHNIL